MPRTTVDIDASVLRELKKRQRRERRPLGQLISELLAKAIASEDDPPQRFTWVTKDLRPRVDLDDPDAVWSVIDKQ